MYEYGVTSLITDKSRVVKGGSWKDGPYFLSPGTRRYLDETTATNWVGFRCAMIRTGDPMQRKINTALKILLIPHAVYYGMGFFYLCICFYYL